MNNPHKRPRDKKPISGRRLPPRLAVALTCGIGWWMVALGQGPSPSASLSEADAIRLALERPAVTSVTEGAVSLAEAEASIASAWPNPRVSYIREGLPGAGGGAEETLALTQQLDLAGKRYLRGKAAKGELAATHLDMKSWKETVASEARLAFYAVLASRDRERAYSEWVAVLRGAAGWTSERFERGDASFHEKNRLVREGVLADAMRARADAEGRSATARLRGLLGLPPGEGAEPLSLAGRVLPEEPLPPLDAFLTQLESRPDLVAMKVRCEAAELRVRAAHREALPDLELGYGQKWFDLPGEPARGGVFTASLVVPIFNSGRGERLKASGEARILEGRSTLLRKEAESEVRALWEEASRLAGAATHVDEIDEDSSPSLQETAMAAYVGGEFSVVELLDACRAHLEGALQKTDIALAAREARILLEKACGGGLQ